MRYPFKRLVQKKGPEAVPYARGETPNQKNVPQEKYANLVRMIEGGPMNSFYENVILLRDSFYSITV